ncbi:MAG: response regulator [Elusimicrobia bacterium]|nr:response regulator [Candidatus Obscuribacterium magneticum]
MKVLLVEDDPDVSETIVSVLENFFEGVEIDHVVDGDGFRKGQWRSATYQLIILDIMMPGITGFDVCRQIRAYPSTRQVPILVLTGYDTPQNEEKIKEAGATAYMAKPFEINTFVNEIKRWVH